jgi:hypothetical protein
LVAFIMMGVLVVILFLCLSGVLPEIRRGK